MPNVVTRATQDLRSLVNTLGIGQFNATLVIPYMFFTPAGTDPDMAAVRVLVEALQAGLHGMGANVPVDGIIDERTDAELTKLTGPDWPGMTWATLFETVIRARASGRSLAPVRGGPLPELEMVGDIPAVPGGLMTIAAAGIAVWYFLLRK